MILLEQINVNIYETPGINFLEVKGSLGEKDLANAITTTRAEKQVFHNFFSFTVDVML